ncbi:MAG: efflux RND transporter periplasmic adaptor subunit [Thiobacillaceae bacterium]
MKPFIPGFTQTLLFFALTGLGQFAIADQPLVCLIQPSRTAEIGTSVIGVIETMRVERGDTVKKGQVIAILRGDVERAALGVANSRAQAEADVRSAVAALEFAHQSTLRAEDLVKKKFVSEQALDKARTEEKVAAQKVAQAREQSQIWDREKSLAQSQLAQRTITSPINGIVAERYLSNGERVENQSMARVVSINPLNVEVMVPVASFGKIQTGMVATVVPDLPGATPVEARVILVDKLIDGASNTFRVRLTLPNPDHGIPAGPRCKVAFGDQVVGGAKSAAVNKPMPKTASVSKPTPMPGIIHASYNVPSSATVFENAATTDIDSSISNAIERWRNAWESKDLIGYLAAYTGDFHGEKTSRSDWLKQREARIQKPDALTIRIHDTQVKTLAGNRVRVQFQQTYQAGGYHANTTKSLLMVREKGQWLIKEERALN